MKPVFWHAKSRLLVIGLLGCLVLSAVVPASVAADPAPDGCGYANSPQISGPDRWEMSSITNYGSTYSVNWTHLKLVGPNQYGYWDSGRTDGCYYGTAPAP